MNKKINIALCYFQIDKFFNRLQQNCKNNDALSSTVESEGTMKHGDVDSESKYSILGVFKNKLVTETFLKKIVKTVVTDTSESKPDLRKFLRHKRGWACMRACLKHKLLHPAMCHSLC